MLVASLDFDTHRGRIAIGRVQRGSIRAGDTLVQITDDGEQIRSRVTWLGEFDGLAREEIERADAGEIVVIAGFGDAKIGATLVDPSNPEALPKRSRSKSRR